jgi:hypothetical protein
LEVAERDVLTPGRELDIGGVPTNVLFDLLEPVDIGVDLILANPMRTMSPKSEVIA